MNKNNTTLICTLGTTGSDVLVWQIGAFLFPVIGLPGHLLAIVTILTSDRQRLHWLDVVNLAPDPRKILNCAYFYPFVGRTAFLSLVLLVLINIDQIRTINKPQKTHTKTTHKRILIKIFLTYITSILFFIHYRFSLKYSREALIKYGQSCSVYDHAYRWFYSIWSYIHLFFRLIPCLILILSALYICWNRYDHNHIRCSSNSIHRPQQTLSIVVVFLSIYAFFAVLPITILQIFNHHMRQYEIDYRYYCIYDRNKSNKWKLLNALFIMWEPSLYTNKFYIRCLTSSEFRYNVKQTIFCRFKNKYRQTNLYRN